MALWQRRMVSLWPTCAHWFKEGGGEGGRKKYLFAREFHLQHFDRLVSVESCTCVDLSIAAGALLSVGPEYWHLLKYSSFILPFFLQGLIPCQLYRPEDF